MNDVLLIFNRETLHICPICPLPLLTPALLLPVVVRVSDPDDKFDRHFGLLESDERGHAINDFSLTTVRRKTALSPDRPSGLHRTL